MLNEIPQPLLQPPRPGDLLACLWSLARIGAVRCEDGAFLLLAFSAGNLFSSASFVTIPFFRMSKEVDVIQDEATEEQSKSGNPMFGDSFPDRV